VKPCPFQQDFYVAIHAVVGQNPLCSSPAYGVWEVDKSGNIIHTSQGMPVAADKPTVAKSAVRVGDYIYGSGENGVYRTAVSSVDGSWATTMSSPVATQLWDTMTTDGTSLYGYSHYNGPKAVTKYSVDATTGALTRVWSYDSVNRVRAISFDSAKNVLYAGEIRGTAGDIYSVSADKGEKTLLGTVEDSTGKSALFQVIRSGNQMAAFFADGTMEVYGMNTDGTLDTSKILAQYEGLGAGSLAGAALSADGKMLWVTSGEGKKISGYSVPEPTSVAMLLTGALGAAFIAYRKRTAKKA
jgi:hypothetical protein